VSTALLVVDVQRGLVDYLEQRRRDDFVRTLRHLIDRARTGGTPVVYVRHRDEELVPNTPVWEIASEIGPSPGERIVEKEHCDSFRETPLQNVLSDMGVDHVVVCGMQTEYCIDATVREADRRGYRVTLVEDGTATYPADGATEAQIQAQVHRVARGRFASIVPSNDVFS
jgi:nicotinamidase-related amidase